MKPFVIKGPNYAVSTACSTGLNAVGDAFRMVRTGDADVMVCGGVEGIAPLDAIVVIGGFCKVRALNTTNNDNPEMGSRPFDASRKGFMIGEGAGIMILEELEHARKRNAYIYGEVLGYGMSGVLLEIFF